MTNEEAYGRRSYEERALAVYGLGDRVEVGPAYRMVDIYIPDGVTGTYHVVEVPSAFGTRDYGLAKHPLDDAEVWCHAARLTLVQGAPEELHAQLVRQERRARRLALVEPRRLARALACVASIRTDEECAASQARIAEHLALGLGC